MERVFRWSRPFPPSTRRALPSSSSTSYRSVLRTRPTPRRSPADYGLCLPACARAPPSARWPLRGLPVPVHEACVMRAELLDPGGSEDSIVHVFRNLAMAFRAFRQRRLRQNKFRGSNRPARSLPSYASPRGSPHAAQGLGFPGVDSSWGRTCSMFLCSHLAHLLSHAGFHRRIPITSSCSGSGIYSVWSASMSLITTRTDPYVPSRRCPSRARRRTAERGRSRRASARRRPAPPLLEGNVTVRHPFFASTPSASRAGRGRRLPSRGDDQVAELRDRSRLESRVERVVQQALEAGPVRREPDREVGRGLALDDS